MNQPTPGDRRRLLRGPEKQGGIVHNLAIEVNGMKVSSSIVFVDQT
jgi:hypothetical protein